MNHDREGEIAQGLQEGRTEAWFGLYDAYAEQVWRLAARLTGSESSDVPDVVQEAFIAAAQSARNYDPARGSLWMWLSGITRRQAALYYRRKARQPVAIGGESAVSTESESEDEPGPAETAEGVELAMQVREALTQLPEDYEVLLTAKYVDGLRVAEIALSENMTEEAVRSKLARARRAFRKLYPPRP